MNQYPPFSRHTRSSGVATGPDRSLLQLERDHVASTMDFTWPPIGAVRQNSEGRGIQTNGVTCYQVALLQTLLHQRSFIRWILNHDTLQLPCTFDDCISCYVKQLVEEYWGNDDPSTAVPFSLNGPEFINDSACDSGLFGQGMQEDAGLFYEWLMDAIYECGDRDTVPAPRSYGPDWKPQFEVLYRLNLQCHDTCIPCGKQTLGRLQKDWLLSLGVNATDTTIQQAITGVLDETVQKVCPCCGQNNEDQTNRRRKIVAAPKILCLRFIILLYTGKILHTLNYPHILDLTNHQEINQLPLKYQLRGVVSHRGEGVQGGHFIATVRDRGMGRFTCFSDNDKARILLPPFLANPVRPPMVMPGMRGKNGQAPKFQAYMLMYERIDRVRRMPARPGRDRGRKRLRRELKALCRE